MYITCETENSRDKSKELLSGAQFHSSLTRMCSKTKVCHEVHLNVFSDNWMTGWKEFVTLQFQTEKYSRVIFIKFTILLKVSSLWHHPKTKLDRGTLRDKQWIFIMYLETLGSMGKILQKHSIWDFMETTNKN